MKKIVLTALVLSATTALMADGKATYAAKCASCHGANGKTKALGKSAVISGQSAAVIAKKLAGYKAGTLNTAGMGAVMKGNMATVDAKGITELSAYIATLK